VHSKRVCLILGNGFSIGLTRGAGVYDITEPGPIFPPPPYLDHLPGKSASTPTQLWTAASFPLLWEHWPTHASSADPTFHGFCRKIAALPCRLPTELEAVHPGTRRGNPISMFPFLLTQPGYELRAYLWYLFRNHHYRLVQFLKPHSTTFHDYFYGPTADYLCSLVRDHLVDIISYNYDTHAENLLARRGVKVDVKPLPTPATVHAVQPTSLSVAIVKPHGSIAFFTAPGLYLGPTPWIDPEKTQGNWMWYGVSVNPFAVYRFPPDKFPFWPDLIPPGHAHDTLAAPFEATHDAAKAMISRSDCVILHGFAATPPDDIELIQLFDGLPPKRVIQVDVRADTISGDIARNWSGGNYVFVNPTDARELASVFDAIAK
jgi:hypothetical protein